MSAKVTITKNGTIHSWQIGANQLLYEERAYGGERRGGIPLCVPMFSVQQRTVVGCDLPLHGLLMYKDPGETTEITTGESWGVTHHFPTSDKFGWDFTVAIQVQLLENALKHSVTIKRADHCDNPNEMPLSLGFHPYFKTYGKDFSLTAGDVSYSKDSTPDDIEESYFAELREDESALFKTLKGNMTITPTGYDEYCLWTDNINTYFCLEPIYQYREFGLPGTGLQAGEEKVFTCHLQFDPA